MCCQAFLCTLDLCCFFHPLSRIFSSFHSMAPFFKLNSNLDLQFSWSFVGSEANETVRLPSESETSSDQVVNNSLSTSAPCFQVQPSSGKLPAHGDQTISFHCQPDQVIVVSHFPKQYIHYVNCLGQCSAKRTAELFGNAAICSQQAIESFTVPY